MATYVLSDVHGHLKALDRALGRVSAGEGDHIYVIGDMVDRGPDPVGVLRLCRSLPNATVMMGNHERMMLDCLVGAEDDLSWLNWAVNGGTTTSAGLSKLDGEELGDLVDWVVGLSLREHVHVGDRDYLLVHAGIRPGGYEAGERWDDAALDALLAGQSDEDLLWIRAEFWGAPTGLVDAGGRGPVVVAGHTPTVMVEQLADRCDDVALAEGGRCAMLHVGACEATGGMPDRLAIDCGAGSVPGAGRVLILRLDDGETFYEDVNEGE